MSEIRDWLNGLGLAEYADAFERERIDLNAVQTLSDADLRELGLPMGPRNRLKAAISALVILVNVTVAAQAAKRATSTTPSSWRPSPIRSDLAWSLASRILAETSPDTR